MKSRTALLSLLLAAGCAQAARPLVTDDARLTTEGSCQVEGWIRASPGSRETWILPSCNPTGSFELSVGGGRATAAGQPATADYVFQAKTVFRTLETNSWGWGMAAGTVRHPDASPGPNQSGNTYAYVPVSVSLADDKVVLHGNLGWLRDKASSRNNLTWGLALESRTWHPRVQGIAETFGDNRGAVSGQVGARFSVLPDLFQVDATFGRQLAGTGQGNWVSFGLRYTPEKLF